MIGILDQYWNCSLKGGNKVVKSNFFEQRFSRIGMNLNIDLIGEAQYVILFVAYIFIF